MVSIRCKMLVKSELENLRLDYKGVELGEVVLYEKIPDEKRDALKAALRKWGLEMMDDKRSILIEKIKT